MSPCVRSGYCCKKAPCQFGEWDADKHQCKFLEVDSTHGNATFYKCGKYKEIKDLPDAKWNPAFGAGCCSPIGNTARETNINSGFVADYLLGNEANRKR